MRAFFETTSPTHALVFEGLEGILIAHHEQDVPHILNEMEAQHRKGGYLAGFASFELGYLLEPRLKPLFRTPPCPLLCFGVFKEAPHYELWEKLLPTQQTIQSLNLTPTWDFETYEQQFDIIKQAITAGDVYQINLTFPLKGHYLPDQALALYAHLRQTQPAPYGGFIALEDQTHLSFSPELFFAIKNNNVTARPMKGTAPRGITPEQDAELAQFLQKDPKSRAENLMILDLLRNDIGRIAEIGSVRVPNMFKIETYPTLHQMTSEVRATLPAQITISDLFRALFPSGSVIGAPKIRALELIHALEATPRGLYCGSMGYIFPNGDMEMNVAIRTLSLDKMGNCTYAVGSGIVHDSVAIAEYRECLLKARFLEGIT